MSAVEKRSPHYDLVNIQADVKRLGAAAFTKAALDGGRAMGLTSSEMLVVVASLGRRDFFKSMTTYADIESGRTSITAPHRSVETPTSS